MISSNRSPGLRQILVPPSVRTSGAFSGWLKKRRIDILAEVDRHGAILIRGGRIEDAHQFAQQAGILFPARAPYLEKSTPRTAFDGHVFSATDLPAAQGIRLHNEDSYTLLFPRYLLFGCQTAAEQGGATIVGDMHTALRLLTPQIVQPFREKGWQLVRNYGSMFGLSWSQAFGTDSRADVEKYAQENKIELEWGSGNELRTRQVRTAIICHPIDGVECWFNHIAFWSVWTLDDTLRDLLLEECGSDCLPFQTYYGDGGEIPRGVISAVNHAYDAVTVKCRWHEGDLLLLDNVRCAHGRDPYSGTRRILVAMGSPIARSETEESQQLQTGPN